MSGRNGWIETDLDGLARTLARKGKGYVITELVRNSLDEDGVTRVDVTLERGTGRMQWWLRVEDDAPGGYNDLAQSYRLFAPSYKVTDTTKAGRFNAGEKFVLALCEQARVTSTTGTIYFDASGRHTGRMKRERGTLFEALLRFTEDEASELTATARRLIIPAGVTVTLNGETLPTRRTKAVLKLSLPTEVAGTDGVLRRTTRMAEVGVYETDEPGWIYELGMPVVETGDSWDVDVQQKVPLTLERDNVPPSYLRVLRTAVLNAMCLDLTPQQATEPWVRDAAGSPDAAPEAVEHVMDLRFGEKRVAYDPSDPEANKLAVTKGYTVVSGGALSGGEWRNVKAGGAILPAGQVTPSPKPFAPNGTPLKMAKDLTEGMRTFERFAYVCHEVAVGSGLTVRFASDIGWPFAACYGHGTLTVNVGRLGKAWFEVHNKERWLALLIHEFAHATASDHLSEKYYDALCDIGAKLVMAAKEGRV